MSDDETNDPVGKCCFCGEECNWMSQSCGFCARRATGKLLAMSPTEAVETARYPYLRDRGADFRASLEIYVNSGKEEEEEKEEKEDEKEEKEEK